MRILMISFDPITEVGGVEGRARTYIRHLVASGHQIHTFDLSRSRRREEITLFGTRVTFLSPSIRQLPVALGSVLKDVILSKPDGIFILSGADTFVGIILLAFSRIFRKKTGVFIYGKDMLYARTHPARNLALKLGLRLARKVGTNSRATATLLPAFAQNKLLILYPGVDPEIIKDLGSIAPSSGKILFVGRLVKRKGADDLIRAFSILVKDLPDASLEIVGDGSERQRLETLTTDLRIQNSVRFSGSLTGVELYQKYAECTVFCMPSRTLRDDVEGFGTVFLEAGIFGKPSVATKSGGITEAIIDGETGLLVEEGGLQALSDALTKLLRSRDLSRTLGDNARRRVVNEFTSAKATERLLGMFD